MMEDGQRLIDTLMGFGRIEVLAVDQIRIPARGGKQVVAKTVTNGIMYGILGGVTVFMTGALYPNRSAKDEMLFGAIVGSTVGAAFGFLD